MTRPGTNITTRDAAGTSPTTGKLDTLYLVGPLELGPTVPTFISTFDEYVSQFCINKPNLVTPSSVADFVGRYVWGFFAEGGARLCLLRLAPGDATVAQLGLVDRASAPVPTLTIVAPSVGAAYNALSVAVANGTAPNTFRLTISHGANVILTTPDLASPAAAVAWLAINGQGFTATDAASSTVAPGNNPAVAAATSLSGGGNGAGTTDPIGALADPALPPGQVFAPYDTGGTIPRAGLTAAVLHNYIVLAGATSGTLPSSTVPSTPDTPTDIELGHVAFFPQVLTVRGPDGISEVAVPGTIIAAALIARGDNTASPSQPAAGAWGVTRACVRIIDEYPFAAIEAATALGLNCFRTVDGRPRLYGFRTLSPSPNRRSLADARVMMALEDDCRTYSEQYVFSRIDSKGHTVAGYAGGLTAICARYFDRGDLYGDTPSDAYAIDVGPTVNTRDTLARGELRARVAVRTTPFAEATYIDLVKTPTTQPI
jgi:hypothetical protein